MLLTLWTVRLDGEPLTWTALAHELRQLNAGNIPANKRVLLQDAPLQFDVAEDLSAKQAQALILWLREWMPEKGHGRLRLEPLIPTHEVARMRERPSQVRL